MPLGARVLEIGCAPGKHLAYIAKFRDAKVTGLDYSEPGIAFCRELFSRLGVQGEFRCENLLSTTLPAESFDVVYSLGVVEHFDDPRPAIEQHLRLAKAGGLVLITVPNYGGVYGTLQRYFDPENLKIHNLDIITPEHLRAAVPGGEASNVRVFPAGRLSPWLIHFQRRWPTVVSRGVSYLLNVIGLAQPFEVKPLCPMLVLKIQRSAKP